jgi:hypothetical protein
VEKPVTAIKINILEEVHCNRDVGTAPFKRARSANVGIGSCASPQPSFKP